MALINSPTRGDITDREREAFVELDGKMHKAAVVRPDPLYPLHIIASEGTAEVKSPYGEILALASGVETVITTYTVPALKEAFLQRVEYGGENIALYRVKLNGTTIAKSRTWWTGDLKGEMIWQQSSFKGYPITAGDVLTVTVIHSRPQAGDFESRIVLIEDNA